MRHDSLYVRYSVAEFQFTHPGGVRPEYVLEAHRPCCVSIHAPGRGATTQINSTKQIQTCFNSRTREGCDDYGDRVQSRLVGFNSRTREGCDATGDACRRRYDVSIHAPGRGATVSSSGCRYQRRGFNSRTREGCDSIDDITYRLYILFQFTHPGGVRQYIPRKHRGSLCVSIHAPGRGAT